MIDEITLAKQDVERARKFLDNRRREAEAAGKIDLQSEKDYCDARDCYSKANNEKSRATSLADLADHLHKRALKKYANAKSTHNTALASVTWAKDRLDYLTAALSNLEKPS